MSPAARRPALVQELTEAAQPEVRGSTPRGTAVEPWPRGISRRASMRISDVLAALQLEFPAVTTSKLRFWEEQGLVAPVRTSAGYRQYSDGDVERLRSNFIGGIKHIPVEFTPGPRLHPVDA